MGFDLTNERIQDTYKQILQISGSSIVDGTGSVAPVLLTSASYAVTASYALNGGGGGATWPVSGTPSGILSSSAQIADDISGSFTSTSASLASDIATNKSDITTKLDTSVYTTNSSSVSTRLTTNEGNISTQTSRVDSLVSATSSYAVKAENNSFSGLQTFNNIAVNGTASIGYLQSVTGSAKIIGDAYIILNNDTPAQRYAGVKVFDSGSTNNSASFEFDGQTNDWFYEYTDDGGATEEFGVVMFGPGYNTRGSHVYPSNNTILKGTGDHHIEDSNITDDGSKVSVSTPLTASSFNVDSGDISFITQSIAIGNGVNSGDQDVSIGVNVNSNNGYSIAIGSNLTNNGTGGNVLLGRSITTTGDYSIGIGEGATPGAAGAVAIGQNANSAGNSVAIGQGATMGSSYGFAGGYNAKANNDASIAVGGDINVSSNQAIGIGTDVTIDASSQGAVSLGQNADISTSTRAVAIGQGSGATGANNGIAIGSGSKVTSANEINIGGIFKYDGSISASIEDNLTINGQINTPTFAGSVASSTSSIDFDNGNFATLSLTAGTFLASPSSLKSGTTYTIIISSGSLVSGHGTAWKFSGGTAPTYTNGTDVLTCVSDGTNLYATALTDFQ